MDRKAILILATSLLLLMLWYPLVNKIYPPRTLTPEEMAAATNATLRAAATNRAEAATASNPVAPPQLATPTHVPVPNPSHPEETLTLENEVARFVFTSHGGGLKYVELKRYREAVDRRSRRTGATNELATLNDEAPLPVLAVTGSDQYVGDGTFTLSQADGAVRAEKLLPNGLRLVKEFRPGTNYLVQASVRFENTGRDPLALPPAEIILGTATPISPRDNGQLMRIKWFNGRSSEEIAEPFFANRTLGCFPGTPRSIYSAAATNLVWTSAQNQFFTLLAVPASNATPSQIVVRHLDLPAPDPAALQADRQMVARPFAFQTALVYPGVVLAPGTDAAVALHYDLFAGPKEYRTLDRLAQQFGNQLDLVMDFSGFFGFFAKALLLSMNGLHALGLSYGLAIIGITIIIKLAFWPLTQASTRSMKRMQLLQPKMKEIQEKYKDDPKKMNEKTMAFMKEHRINPAAGCLPILIQIPVFFGFYRMLQSAIELRGASFLWAVDLSQPDTIFYLPGLGLPVNPLPIIMGLTQFWQMRLTPPSPGMDPVQQKIFQYMPLIFLFILYNFSSGLTLYWTVQNLLTIAQMKLTKSTGEPAAPHAHTHPHAPATRPTRKSR